MHHFPVRRPTFLALTVALLLYGSGSAPAETIPLDPGAGCRHGKSIRLDWERAHGTDGDKGGQHGDAAVGSLDYDMISHVVDVRIDPDLRRIDGEVTFTLASRIAGLTEAVLDLSEALPTTAVTAAGGGTLAYVHVGDSVVVDLATPLDPGEQVSFTLAYGGYPIEPAWDRGLMFKVHNDVDGTVGAVPIVANVSEPAFAKYWWPCKDRPGDKALSTMIITVPQDLVAVSNGVLVAEEPAAEPGWHRYQWREDYPIASYLVSVAISDYVPVNADCVTDLGSDIPLRNWVFPMDYDDAVEDFAPLCDMLIFSEKYFGPYPFQGEKYGHAEMVWWGAMEHQTVTSIGNTSIHGDGSNDWLIVHELAHQWFGDHLTPATWADIWLNEGFATYAEALWREEESREAYFADLAAGRTESSWALQGPVYDPVPIFPGGVIYDKAAWILHMLRGRMGDDDFFGLLKEWSRRGGSGSLEIGTPPHVGYNVTTAQFTSLASSWAGEDLAAFFDPYLNETVLPKIVFEYELAEGIHGPDTHLTVFLRQVQTPLFDNVFPVVVTMDGDLTTQVRIRLDQATAVAEFDLDTAVTGVELDPERWVLWNPAAGVGTVPGLTLTYPNPLMGNVLNLRYHLESASRVTLRVYDAMGREVDRRDLGWVEPEAGFNECVWGTTDHAGGRVAAGVYWAALEIDGARSVGKFTIIR